MILGRDLRLEMRFLGGEVSGGGEKGPYKVKESE